MKKRTFFIGFSVWLLSIGLLALVWYMYNSLSSAYRSFIGVSYTPVGAENFILVGAVSFPICIAMSWVMEKLGIGKAKHRSYRHYQEQQRTEREDDEAYEAGRRWAEGVEDYRREQRERREYERSREYPGNVRRTVFGSGDDSGDIKRIERFIFGDDSRRKRKKRRG